MRRFSVFMALLALSAVLPGCGKVSDQERLTTLVPNAQATTPVSGQVLVDGEAVKDIWVTLHEENEQPESLQPKAQTDEEGKFKITTYIGGDGAPAGKYNITVEWLTFKQFGSQWVGPNKVGGPCGDAKTTEFKVEVGNEPIELPVFEVEASASSGKSKSQKGTLSSEKHK